jgi:hypothetical protein
MPKVYGKDSFADTVPPSFHHYARNATSITHPFHCLVREEGIVAQAFHADIDCVEN